MCLTVCPVCGAKAIPYWRRVFPMVRILCGSCGTEFRHNWFYVWMLHIIAVPSTILAVAVAIMVDEIAIHLLAAAIFFGFFSIGGFLPLKAK